MTVRWSQMRQTTTAEVRLGARKEARFNVSAQSTGGFDRLLRARCAIAVAENTKRDDPGLAPTRNPGNSGLRVLALRVKGFCIKG